MSGSPNAVTAEQMKALRERFSGKLSKEDAVEALRVAGRDEDVPPIVRLHVPAAMMEIAGAEASRAQWPG